MGTQTPRAFSLHQRAEVSNTLTPQTANEATTMNKLTVQRKKSMGNSNKNINENGRETKPRIIESSSDRVPQTSGTLCRE